MNPSEVLDQLRRILLLAAGGRKPTRRAAETDPTQFDLFGSGAETATPPTRSDEPLPEELHDRIHAFGVELIALLQMEGAGLVPSPVARARQRRRLGGSPATRLLEEWSRTPALDESRWSLGEPAPSREEAYTQGLGRARALAERLDLTRSEVEEVVRRLMPLALKAEPEDDLPGLVHGHGLRHRLVRSTRGRPAFRADRTRSRGNGILYTPLVLTDSIARAVLDPALLSPNARKGDPADFCLVDPACGSGQFLLASVGRMLAARGDDSGDDPGEKADVSARLSIFRSMHGLDLDPRAAWIAAHNLSLMAVRLAGDDPLATDAALGASYPYLLGDRIQVGNALSSEPSTFSAGFRWERRFPHVFERETPGFDVVLGNPPWISYGLRDRDGAGEEERTYYERLYPAAAQYKLSLYPLFIELALRLCRPGGHHGYLVPDSLLSGHHFSRIRELLLEEADLLELSLLESAPWPGASTGFTLFYSARKKGGALPPPKHVRNRVLQLARGHDDEETTARAVGPEVLVPLERYQHGNPMRIYRESEELEFIDRMERSPLRFRDVAWTYSGLIARHGQKSVQADAPRSTFELRDTRGALVYVSQDALRHWRPALLSGAEVMPYRALPRGGYLYLPEARENLTVIWKSGFDLERYRQSKILLRQTGDRLIGAVDREGLYCLNNLHLIGSKSSPRIPPLLLLGALASEPVQRIYRIYSPEVSRPLAQVDLEIVLSLPYPVDGEGQPIGAGPWPARSHPPARRWTRQLDRWVEQGDRDGLLEAFDLALRAAGEPLDDGPLSGRDVVHLLLSRLLEIREASAAEPKSPRRSRARATDPVFLQSTLDGIYSLLFGLTTAASPR